MESTAPGLLASGDWGTWLQQVASYGLGRKWDSEYLLPYTTAKDQQYFQGADGRYYKAGQTVPMTAGGVSPVLLVAGVAAVALVAYLALR